jgi:hypothetical protein
LFKQILNAVNRGNTIEIAIDDNSDISYLPSDDFASLKAYVKEHYGKEYVELLES